MCGKVRFHKSGHICLFVGCYACVSNRLWLCLVAMRQRSQKEKTNITKLAGKINHSVGIVCDTYQFIPHCCMYDVEQYVGL